MPRLDLLAEGGAARFKADLASVIQILRRQVADLLGRLPRDAQGRLTGGAEELELAAKLEASASKMLTEAGYDGALGKLRLAFSRVIRDSGGNAATISRLGLGDGLGASHASVNESSLLAFANGTVDALLTRFPPVVGSKMREALLQGSQTGAPLAKVIEEVAQAAASGLAPAITEVLTALMAVGREAQAQGAERSGIDLYIYDGPDDDITRPFCALFVGKLVTIPDLDAQDNHQGLKPTHAYLGGYRCRHSLSPITLDEAQALWKAHGESAFGFGCSVARRIVAGGEVGPNEAALTSRISLLAKPPQVLKPPKPPRPPKLAPKPVFKPAATVTEAVDSMRSLGAEPSTILAGKTIHSRIPLTSVSEEAHLAYLNDVNAELHYLKDRFPGWHRNIAGVGIADKPNPYGVGGEFSLADWTITNPALDKDAWDTWLARAPEPARLADKDEGFTRNTTRHELAHALDFSDTYSLTGGYWGISGGGQAKFHKLVASAAHAEGMTVEAWIEKRVSKYANKDLQERFAEIVTLMSGRGYVRGTLYAPLERFIFGLLEKGP